MSGGTRAAIEHELRSLRIRREQLDREMLEVQRAEWASQAVLNREKLRRENRTVFGTVKLAACYLFALAFAPGIVEPVRWAFGAGVADSFGEALFVFLVCGSLAALGVFKVWQILNDREFFLLAPPVPEPDA